jgi:WD40 repeat protein
MNHPGAVRDAMLSRDEQLVISLCKDGQARVWLRSGGKPAWTVAEVSRANCIALSPTEPWLATGHADGTVHLWDLDSGRPAGPTTTNHETVLQIQFRSDGKRLVAACEGRSRVGGAAQVWDVRTGNPIGGPLTHDDDVTAVAFSPDGNSVLTASSDRTARVWDAATGAPRTPPLWHRGPLADVRFTPDGNRAATLTEDGDVRLWDSATGEAITPTLPHRHEFSAGCLAFSPDGNRLLVATGGDSIAIREFARNGERIDKLMAQAEVLSAHRIAGTAGLLPLDTSTLSNAWQRLRRP